MTEKKEPTRQEVYDEVTGYLKQLILRYPPVIMPIKISFLPVSQSFLDYMKEHKPLEQTKDS